MAGWEESGYYNTSPLTPEAPAAPPSSGEEDYLGRGRFKEQLLNPHALDRLIGYTKAEVGGQGPDAQQAFIETTFNRGVARDQDLFRVLSGSYFPLETHVRGQRRVSDQDRAYYQPIIDRVLGGSNITNYATGNASGRVGFAGGPQTYASGGERYGIEGPDRDWWKKVNGPGLQTDQSAIPAAARPTSSAELPEWAKSPYYGGGADTTTRATTQPPGAAATAQPSAPTTQVADSGAWFNSPYYGGSGEEAPAAQPMIEAAPEAAKPPKAGAFMSGLVSGFSKENPEMLANFLEGMSYQAPEMFQPTLQSMAGKAREYATVPEGYEKTAKSWENIEGIGDAANWALETAGSGFASMAPTITGAAVGGIAGGLSPIPGGAAAGAIAGGLAPGYALNYGEVYGALKEAGVDPKAASGWAAAAAVPISALDAVSLGNVAGLAGVGPAKRAVARGFASRVARGLAEGSLGEGSTEGAQELLKNVTVDMAAGAQPGGVFRGVPEAAVGGALVGGPIGGAGGAIARPGAKQEGVPPADGLPGKATGSVVPDEIFELPENATLARGVITPGGVVPLATNEGEKLPQPVDTNAALNNNPEGNIVVRRRAEEGPFTEFIPSDEPIYYSQLLKQAEEKLPRKGSAEQIIGMLRNPQLQVRQEEIDDMGLEPYLRSLKGPITREQVLDYVRANTVQLQETYTEDADTRYSEYLAPGPYLKYGELRVSVPFNPMQGPAEDFPRQREEFEGTHWGSEGNVLFHVQMTTRTDKAGNPTLHIEGIQSDWIQLGQRVGFLSDEDSRQVQQLEGERLQKNEEHRRLRVERETVGRVYSNIQKQKRFLFDTAASSGVAYNPAVMASLDQQGAQTNAQYQQLSAQIQQLRTEIDEAGQTIRSLRTVADPKYRGELVEKPAMAPMRTKYVDMALRRMIKWAADRGYSRVSIASPELAIRYNTGAQGNEAVVEDSVKKGLNHWYGSVYPSRLRDVAKEFGGVREKQLIDVGTKYPQFEIRPQAMPDGTTGYQIWNVTNNEGAGIYANEAIASQIVYNLILASGLGPYRVMLGYAEGLPVWDIYRENDPQSRTVEQFNDEMTARGYAERKNREIVREARAEAGRPQYTEVWGVTVPETTRTAVQSGIRMYELEVPRGPAVDVDYAMDRRAGAQATPEFLQAVDRMAALFNEFAKKFGFDNKVRLQMDWSPLDPTAPNAWGLATQFQNGTYLVQVRADYFKGNILGLYSTMMHEFGHVVQWELFDNLPAGTKLAIKDAHKQWQDQALKNGTLGGLSATRQSAIRHWMAKGGTTGAHWSRLISSLPRDFQDYSLSFEEWFADQVARWATTTEEPVGVVEKAFSSVGKAVRFYLEWMAKKLGVDPRPTLLMQNWLNSVAFGVGPMGAQTYATLDLRTQKQNQYYVGIDGSDHDISMPPQQPATGSTRNTMGQVFSGSMPPQIKAMGAHADRINWFYKHFAGLLELAAANPRFAPLLAFVERNRQMHNDEARVHDAGLRIVKDWRRLGKAQGDSLVNFMDEMANMEYLTPQEKNRGVVRQPTSQEEAQLKAKTKLNADGNTVYLKVKDFFDKFLQLNKANAIAEAMKITDPVVRVQKIDEINAVIRKMQARPYFPFMRFGRHYVTVRNPNGVVLHFETFERKGLMSAERRQQRKVQELKALHPNDTVSSGVLPESTEPFIGLPGPLLDHIKNKMNLTPAQLDALQQLQFELSPALSFRHHFQQKNFTPGYSRDFMRAFARYTFHGGRYYARTRHIDALRDLIRDARKVEDNKAHRIADYMTDHLDNTILDVKGDYGIFKGAIFFWAMGFVPAAATQNMSQTPLVTFPFLASKFGGLGIGEARASKAIARAATQLSNFYKRGTYDGKNLSQAWEMRAISYGIKTGRVTETQAAEIAGIAQGGNLIFGAGGTELQRIANWIQEKSASFFELAEQWNRRIAYRATLELAMNHPNAPIVQEAVSRYPLEYQDLTGKEGFTPSQARAILAANHVVESTQLVYGRYARPRFMRGRLAGTIFVFKRFIQGMVFLGINNPSFMWRYVLLMMLMGGMGGIPGYEDLKGLVEGILRWMGYNANAEVEIRKLIMAYGNPEVLPPDLVLHGLARRGYGLPALSDMLGSYVTGYPGRGFDATTSGKNVPFPQLDRSKAITFGPLLPVEIGKLIDPSRDRDKLIAEQAQRASGAVFSVGFNIYRALMDKELDASDWKRWEKAVPRMLGASSKAYRTYSEGRERSGREQGGATVVNYDRRDTEQMMEVIAMGLGYNNLRASSKWDEIIAQNEHIKFLDFQRDALLDQLHEAVRGGNPQEREAVRQRIQEFNAGIAGTPDRGKQITAETAQKSLTGRERERIARERGVPTQKTNVPIARQFQGLFPETTVDVQRR